MTTKMTKKRKVLWMVMVGLIVAALIFVGIAFIPKSNPYFKIIENFTATKTDSFGQYDVSGKVQNKTDETLNVNVTITVKNSFGESHNQNFDIIFNPNETVTIINYDINAFANEVGSVSLKVDGKTYTYKIGGNSAFNVAYLAVIIPLIVGAFIVFIGLGVTSPLNKTFDYYNNQLANVNLRIHDFGHSASSREIERLKREKQYLENEIAKFSFCEYCGAKNNRNTTKCTCCGANLK